MRTMQNITELLSAMKFRRKIFNGVDEADVWRQIESLQRTYQLVYDEQAAYYQALIDERDRMLAQAAGRKGSGDAHG